MIQRIQTIYLLIAIICLSIVLMSRSVLIEFFGVTIEKYQLTIMGIIDQAKVPLHSKFSLPLYLGPIILIPLLVFALFSFKNLKRQKKLITLSIVFYSILMTLILIVYFFHDLRIEGAKVTALIGSGFYILGIGLPFLVLANNGISRDKKLIDSLNRIR
jgi:hypothetical protein